ncbi:hypothetical protein [Roseicyclus mahoneyensis]|nr:hypothetical protein [Roseicyclus mahoneyensis]
MRLFSARVSKASLTACVALVLPPDLVTRNEGQDVSGLSDAPIVPVAQGAGDPLPLIVPAGTPDRPFELWVDRSTVDDVIGFARQHGVYPAMLEVPTLEGGETIALPIQNEASPPPMRAFGQAQANPDSMRAEIPPAVLRELEKRKQQETRHAARSLRSAPSEVAFAASAKDEAAALALASRITATFSESVEPVARQLRGLAAPRAQDAGPPDARPALPDQVAAAMPQETADDRFAMSVAGDPFVTFPSAGQIAPRPDAQPEMMTLSAVPVRPRRDMGPMVAQALDGMGLALLAPVHAVARMLRMVARGAQGVWSRSASGLSALRRRVLGGLMDTTHGLRRKLQPGLDAVSVIFLRPVVGAAAVIGIVATGAVALVLPLFAPGQAETRLGVAAPIHEASPDRDLATGTDRMPSAIPTHVPVALAVARAEPALTPLSQPAPPVVTETATAEPPDLGPVVLTQSASVEHSPQSRAVPAAPRLMLRPGSASVQTSVPAPVIPDAATAAVLAPQPSAQGEAAIAGVSSRVDVTPELVAMALLSVPEIDEDLPARLVDTDTARHEHALSAPPVVQSAAPAVAEPVAQDRPAIGLDPTAVADPPPVVAAAPARAVPQADTPPQTLQAAVVSLGPDRAPRPLRRPELRAPARVVAAAVVAPAPTLSAPTQPVARPVAPPAAPAQEVAPVAMAPTLEVLPHSPSNPFRVLAIVGTGAQGTALVRTGPNQTAVLAAGTTTALGQVVDVRRDGIVFVQDGRMRLLPIGQ